MVDMVQMIALAIVFIYLVMVAQFQSILSPFIVLFTIPLAFTGGLLALLITGETLSIISMMGFLVLAGVVVNNGIVFVDYANQLRLEGVEKKEALDAPVYVYNRKTKKIYQKNSDGTQVIVERMRKGRYSERIAKKT